MEMFSPEQFGITMSEIKRYKALQDKFFPEHPLFGRPSFVVLPDDDPETEEFNTLSGKMLAMRMRVAQMESLN